MVQRRLPFGYAQWQRGTDHITASGVRLMPSVAYDTGTIGFERRIGRRLALGPVPVSWLEVTSDGRARPKGHEWPGVVENVSITGAAVTGPADLPVKIGAQALLRYRDGESVVTVTRVQTTDRPGEARFGIEFVVLHPDLRALVHDRIAEGGPVETDWYRAH